MILYKSISIIHLYVVNVRALYCIPSLDPIQSQKAIGLPLDIKILPVFLEDAGYSTDIVSNWCLGYANGV